MYIQRALLLLILVVAIFLPTWVGWTLEHPTAWYRPQLLWLGAILIIYLSQRNSDKNEL